MAPYARSMVLLDSVKTASALMSLVSGQQLWVWFHSTTNWRFGAVPSVATQMPGVFV